MSIKRALIEVGIFLLFLLLAAAMTWPLARNLERAISDPGDPFFTTWTLDWDYYATRHRLPLFQATIFYPDRYAFALSEHMFGIALPLFPLFLLGIPALTIHNIAILLGFATSGYALYLLARWITGSTLAAITGGIAFAFVGYRFLHLPHLHFIWSMWLPLLLLALLVYVRNPTARTAALFAACFLMNGLSTLHWFAFGSFAIAATAVFAALVAQRVVEPRFWAGLIASVTVAMLLMSPFILPYRTASKMYGTERSYEEAIPNSGEWIDWFNPVPQSKVYGRFSRVGAQERALFPGFVVFGMALVGLVTDRREDRSPWNRLAVWCAILWIVVGALGARGLHGFLHTLLFRYSSAFRGIRMPIRWVMIAYVGLAILVAVGMARILRNRSPVQRILLTSVVALALLVELRAAPIRWYLVPLEPRPLYDWIAEVPIRGAILELPMEQSSAYEYLWRATLHHKPLINGVSSSIPRDYVWLASLYDQDTIPSAFLSELARRRCSLVVVHEGALRERASSVRAWLRREVESGKLTFVRRFDAGTRGDYIFALTQIEPAAAAWRLPERPDPSGHTPQQNAQIFLTTGGWTYSGDPFAFVESGPIRVIRGELTVRGWALAPAGVSRVNLRFANGTVIVPATFYDRPDIHAALPWYPKVKRAGFTATLVEPFPGIHGSTDLQVEVVDGAGHSRRNPPFWFRWYRAPALVPKWNERELEMLLERLGPDAVRARGRIVSGAAAIHDFVPPLLSDPLKETDAAFVDHALTVLMGQAPERRLSSRYLQMLDDGSTHEEVLAAILTSPEFASRYLRSGRITIDSKITSEP